MGSIPVEEAKPTRDFTRHIVVTPGKWQSWHAMISEAMNSVFHGLGLEDVPIDWPPGLICLEPSALKNSCPYIPGGDRESLMVIRPRMQTIPGESEEAV